MNIDETLSEINKTLNELNIIKSIISRLAYYLNIDRFEFVYNKNFNPYVYMAFDEFPQPLDITVYSHKIKLMYWVDNILEYEHKEFTGKYSAVDLVDFIKSLKHPLFDGVLRDDI